MTDPTLYHLPATSASMLRAFLARTAAILLLVALGAAWILGQRFAATLGYPPQLGAPTLAWRPTLALPAALAAVLLALLAIIDLAGAIRRRAVTSRPLLAALLALLAWAVATRPIYSPTDPFVWWVRFRHYRSIGPAIAAAGRVWLLVAAAAMAVAVVVLIVRLPALRRRPDIHGSAGWASDAEVKATGLLAPGYFDRGRRVGVEKPGLFVGFWPRGGQLVPMVDRDPRHVFAFAPTRSGKGVGLVLPNLLTWPGSVLVHDIKGENWSLTSGWRSRELGSRTLRFDPTDTSGTTARYNPLLEIRPGQNAVRDAMNVAEIIMDPSGDEKAQSTHWDRTARSLLTASILHVLHDPRRPKTLAEVANLFAPPVKEADHETHSPHELLDRPLIEMRTFPHLPDGPHPTISALASEVYFKPSEEKGSVISTALAYLGLYRDPILAANLEVSDFRPADLMQGETPLSLYLTVPPTDLARTRPILRLLLHQFLARLVEHLEFADGKPVAHFKQPLLLMLDEFPALGRLPFFANSLAYVAGYGLRAYLIAQDLSQHQGIYGREESITANCGLRIGFGPNKLETAELLSKMTGDTTVHQTKRSLNFGGGGGLFGGRRVTISQSETRRPLLTPEEVARLPAAAELLFRENTRPIYCRRARYWEVPELARRAALEPPSTSRASSPLENPWPYDPGFRWALPATPSRSSRPRAPRPPSTLLEDRPRAEPAPDDALHALE